MKFIECVSCNNKYVVTYGNRLICNFCVKGINGVPVKYWKKKEKLL